MSWFSDAVGAVSNTVSNTVSSGYDAASRAVNGATGAVSDFGHAAVAKAADLGRQGLDTGRRALGQVSADVSHAASVVKKGAVDAGHAVEGAAQSGRQEAKHLNAEYHLVDRGLGAARAVGGGLEVAAGTSLVVAGAATSELGIGVLGVAGGSVIVAHGLDQTQAGVRQAVDAHEHDDFTSQGLQAAGVPRGVANGIDTGASVVFSVGGAAGAKGLTVAAERAAGTEGTAIATEQAAAGSYPEGLAYRADLPQHLAGPDGFTKAGQLSGTHNQLNAVAELEGKGATYTVKPTSTPGISELRYSYTNTSGKVINGAKTVYDPAVHGDQAMLDLSQKAGQRAFELHAADPTQTTFNLTQDGVNVRAYINFDKATGAPYVGNVHPVK